MKMIVMVVVAFYYGANGAFMLFDPVQWYNQVPGVPHTGPMNSHFIRDIGFIYLLSGLCFVLACRQRENYRLWLAVGSAWPGLHAIFHIAEWFYHRSEERRVGHKGKSGEWTCKAH